MTRCYRMTRRRRRRRIRMDERFAKTLKHLRLWGVLAHWDEYVALAEQQDFSPIRLLRHVLEEESKLHAANSRRLRLLRAQIPDPWRMETFPFERQPNLNKKRLLSLYDAFEYIDKHHNLCWIGPTEVVMLVYVLKGIVEGEQAFLIQIGLTLEGESFHPPRIGNLRP